MRTAQELDPPQFAGVALLPDEQELARVDHGFHHHVVLAGLFGGADDLPALVDRGGGRHGAGHVLAAFSAAILWGACRWMGVLMCTASTSGSFNNSSKWV